MSPRNPSSHPLALDLDAILASAGGALEELRGQRVFITGGTGFFGTWLLETLAWANEHMDLRAQALVLTRDPEGFRDRCPRLAAHPNFAFHAGDVTDFAFPAGRFSHVIHAATTSAAATYRNEEPLAKYRTIVGGTERTLDFLLHCGAQKLLLTSSGAVYGRPPGHLDCIPEDHCGLPDSVDPRGALGISKRTSEFLCTATAQKHGFEAKIARCFTFVGPHLQLGIHYAVGNFIRDAAAGGPIRVNGDGTAIRSYLYAADLVVWLFRILANAPSCRAYNVGSDQAVSIADLARSVAEASGTSPGVQIMKRPVPGQPQDRYVPSIRRAREELGLEVTVDLHTALRRTLDYCRAGGSEAP